MDTMAFGPSFSPEISVISPAQARHIRLALFDLDGTIVRSDGTVSEPTRRAFEQLRRRGIAAGLATSRPWFACCDIISYLRLGGPSISFSGAMVLNPENGAVIHERAIQAPTLTRFAKETQRRGLLTEYFSAYRHYYNPKGAPEGAARLIAIHSDEYLLGQRPEAVKSLDFAQRAPVLKVVVTAEDALQTQSLRELADAFPDLSHAFVSGGATHPELLYLNTTAPNAGRHEALRVLCQYLEIDPLSNVMAFGDSEGDLPILMNVAVGVALGNSPASVKDQVSYKTLPVDQEGVSQFIMRSF